MDLHKDQLYATQPYFVFDTQGFRQKIFLRRGLSHVYTYRVRKGQLLRAVPDACIDVIFRYGEKGTVTGYAVGTRLQYEETTSPDDAEVFGARFMPGVKPEMLEPSMRELLARNIPLQEALKQDVSWIGAMYEARTFEERTRIFWKAYDQQERHIDPPYGKSALVRTVKQLAYESDGRIRIHEIARQTGYTERYIRRIFLEEMGFSPKTFCKIIQFQRAIQLLNYGDPDNMTTAAAALGYYDQPQFIRDFTRCAGITPRRYLRLVKEKNYRKIIASTEYVPDAEDSRIEKFRMEDE
jgi:AraC-like DNA-binding protein